MAIIKKYFFVLICCFFTTSVVGQVARSPFSTYGLGETYGSSLAHNQGMAGVGVSTPQVLFLNNQNPAMLVYNTFTVFQAGIVGERKTIRTDSLSEKTTGGNLNYLITSFPIKPGKWTTSLGLMPYTNVNYSFQYTSMINGSTDEVRVTEEGSGGITQLYWSNGIKLTDEIAVGLKTAYLFGSTINSYTNQLINGPPPNYPIELEEKSYVKDFSLSGGFSFTKDSLFNRNLYRLSVGLVYNVAADLNTRKTDRLMREGILVDSAQVIGSVKGSTYIPASITAGISLSRDFRWSVGTEFTYQDWSSFKSINRDEEGLGKSWKVALGGEITPDPFAVEKFLKLVTYRAGVSMEQYAFSVNNKSVKDVGINFGISTPASRTSSIDLGIRFGKRGNKKDTIFEENYFRVFFGITINDHWFIKRKFD
jgi:hypothetical protein